MKSPAFLANLPRGYVLALAGSLVIVLLLQVTGLIGCTGALALAALAVFAVVETAILRGHIPFNYG